MTREQAHRQGAARAKKTESLMGSQHMATMWLKTGGEENRYSWGFIPIAHKRKLPICIGVDFFFSDSVLWVVFVVFTSGEKKKRRVRRKQMNPNYKDIPVRI